MIDLEGSTYPRVTNDPYADYTLEYARATITHEGARVDFCESSQKMKGIEGHVSLTPDDIAKMTTDMIYAMNDKIRCLEARHQEDRDNARDVEYEKNRLLEAACDLIVRGSDYDCETSWQARELIKRCAREIREARLREYESYLAENCEEDESED